MPFGLVLQTPETVQSLVDGPHDEIPLHLLELADVGEAGVDGEAAGEDGVEDVVLGEAGEEVLFLFGEVAEDAGVVGFGEEGGVETGDDL